MKTVKLWIATVVLLSSLQTIAQEKSKRFYIGDKVPDIEFKGMYNYPRKTAKLSDFKGKAVILDFWNKGCSSCIAYFPKMQELQEEFKDDLVILLVNNEPADTREVLDPLFRRSPILRGTTLPMVLGDENYKYDNESFPHYGVPYHVWIDKNGIIQATTSSEEATRENFQMLIKGKPLDVIKRVDVLEERDNQSSWLSYSNGKFINSLVYYRSANFTYKYNGENIDLGPLRQLNLGERYHSMLMKDPQAGNKAGGNGGRLNNSHNKKIGFYGRVPILSHYRAAYGVGSSPVIVEDSEFDNLSEVFIYEYTHPDFSDSLFIKTYQQDLENYFGYKGTEEIREIESYILFRTNKALELTSKGGPEILEDTKSSQGTIIQNMNFGILRNCFSDPKDKFGNLPSVIDETGIDASKKIDMTVRGNLYNLSKLNMSLSKYGLGIKKESRRLPVLVLKKRQQLTQTFNANRQIMYSINGKVTGLPDNTKVYIIAQNEESKLDTLSTAFSNGEFFCINGVDESEGKIHFLAIDNNDLKKVSQKGVEPMAIVVEQNNIAMVGSIEKWPEVKFVNSPTNESYYKLIQDIRIINRDMKANYPDNHPDWGTIYSAAIKRALLKYPDGYGTSIILGKYTTILSEDDLRSIYEAFSSKIKNGYYGRIIKKILDYKTDLTEVVEGKIIPDFKFPTAADDSMSIKQFAAGKQYVLIDFWASWCSPCRQEIPRLKEVYSKYGGKGLGIISISIDKSKSAWEDALKKEAMPWVQVRDNLELISGNIFRVSSLPAYVLIDKEGKLLSFQSAVSGIESFGPGLRDEELQSTLLKLFGW